MLDQGDKLLRYLIEYITVQIRASYELAPVRSTRQWLPYYYKSELLTGLEKGDILTASSPQSSLVKTRAKRHSRCSVRLRIL